MEVVLKAEGTDFVWTGSMLIVEADLVQLPVQGMSMFEVADLMWRIQSHLLNLVQFLEEGMLK